MKTLACASILLAQAAIPAAAATLNPATSRVQCVVSPGSGSVFDPSTCSLGQNGPASASAQVQGEPFISLAGAVAAAGATPNIVSGAVTALLSYEFQVTGGNPGDTVPVIFNVALATTGGDGVHSRGFADVHVVNSFGTVTDVAACTAGSGCGGPASFFGSFSTLMRPGVKGTVDLQISAFAGSSPLNQAASASLDPYIVIDPSFANAALYRVEVSPGVANVPLPAVPEPAAAVLMALGGLLLAGLRAAGCGPVGEAALRACR